MKKKENKNTSDKNLSFSLWFFSLFCFALCMFVNKWKCENTNGKTNKDEERATERTKLKILYKMKTATEIVYVYMISLLLWLTYKLDFYSISCIYMRLVTHFFPITIISLLLTFYFHNIFMIFVDYYFLTKWYVVDLLSLLLISFF